MNNGNRATSTVSRVAGAVKGAATAWNRAVTVTWNPWILHPHTVNTTGTASVDTHRITAAVHQVTGITAILRIIHLPAAVPAVTNLQSTAPHCSITVAILQATSRLPPHKRETGTGLHLAAAPSQRTTVHPPQMHGSPSLVPGLGVTRPSLPHRSHRASWLAFCTGPLSYPYLRAGQNGFRWYRIGYGQPSSREVTTPSIRAIGEDPPDLGQEAVVHPRLKWMAHSLPVPPEADKEFSQPTEVPKACWQQRQEDAYSWCQPEKAPPARVEGAASTSKPRLTSSKPHQIFLWNESRDTELHDLEALAQDGLHLVNASIIHRRICGMKSRTPSGPWRTRPSVAHYLQWMTLAKFCQAICPHRSAGSPAPQAQSHQIRERSWPE